MEIIKYEIKKGDTLESIAKEFGINVNELVDFHNSKAAMTQQFFGDSVPMHVSEIFVKKASTEANKKINYKEADFAQKARYRSEQINTSKFNGNLIHYFCQNFQHLLKYDLEQLVGFVKLEDYNKESTPNSINEVFDFIEETEKIKNNVYFKISSFGRLEKILNKNEVESEWNDFKTTKFNNIPFIRSLQEANPEAVKELLKMGDIQFSKNSNNEEEYWRNFFYFLCFDQYLFEKENYEELEFDFASTIVPPLIIPLKIRYDKVSENNNIFTIRKIAEVQLTDSLIKKIEKRYDELHKHIVKYDFTQYKIIFRSTIELDQKTRTLLNGKVVLKEEISDNVENECTYTLKKLENFTP